MIKVEGMTMAYPNGRGIFDINFEVKKGEVVGFLGPNGAGKTTTIRCLLGFMKPQSGNCTINGRDCFECAPQNCKEIGFIAGEPTFPEGMAGDEYLKFLCDVRASSADTRKTFSALAHARKDELIKYFDFDPKGRIKRMSKGMKQKVAIVAAFMHDPDIYILDEPTSGLDPIMQIKFVDFIKREKERGKTILMSTHNIGEIKNTADSMLIIRSGKIIKTMDKKEIAKTSLEEIVKEYYS